MKLPTDQIFPGDNVAALQTWPDACIEICNARLGLEDLL